MWLTALRIYVPASAALVGSLVPAGVAVPVPKIGLFMLSHLLPTQLGCGDDVDVRDGLKRRLVFGKTIVVVQ